MALFLESELKSIAARKVNNDRRYSSGGYTRDSVQKSLLSESAINFSFGERNFDIFLSHSFSDKDLVLGVKTKMESYGHSVYVDWIDDYSMDRANITAISISRIKQRMQASRCLLYATSSNSSNSKWMPWETGYMDGFTGKVAIIPIATSIQYTYTGIEYLGSYPYIEEAGYQHSNQNTLWVTDQVDRLLYTEFDSWLKGNALTRHNN